MRPPCSEQVCTLLTSEARAPEFESRRRVTKLVCLLPICDDRVPESRTEWLERGPHARSTVSQGRCVETTARVSNCGTDYGALSHCRSSIMIRHQDLLLRRRPISQIGTHQIAQSPFKTHYRRREVHGTRRRKQATDITNTLGWWDFPRASTGTGVCLRTRRALRVRYL